MAAPTFLPAKVYFDVGAAAIDADGSAKIAAAEAVKKSNLKVTVTGYTDRTGDRAQIQELASSRAAGVRAARSASRRDRQTVAICTHQSKEYEMAGWFELGKSSDDQFRFVLKADNAETILSSEQYVGKDSCRRRYRLGANELFRRLEVRTQDLVG